MGSADAPPAPRASLPRRCLAEALGTFLLVFLGCGAVHCAVLTGALQGLWQVAIVWGVAVALAGFSCGGVSGAHVNPAMTVALAVWGRCRWADVVPYAVSQLAGAFLAAAVLFALFAPLLARKEAAEQVFRGRPGSEITASCYGEYYPSPGLDQGLTAYRAQEGQQELLDRLAPLESAFAAEVVATMLLSLVVFALTDDRNGSAPPSGLAPAFIGLAVAALIAVVAPLTQACLNPARDFGPRLFAAAAGWGPIALPGVRGSGTYLVYLAAPTLGAVVGGGLHHLVLRPALAGPTESTKGN